MTKAYFAHESCYVDDGATIGKGTRIWHFCHIMPEATIGERCTLGQNVYVGSGVKIGNDVKIQNNVSLYPGVIVEDGAFVGPSAVFTNVINPRSHINRKHEFQTTRIGRGVTIGANATIICGLSLGQCSFVGAGAVVTRDVPNFGVVYGNPARLHGWICHCGTRLDFTPVGAAERATCSQCSSEYEKQDDVVSCIEWR